MKSWAFPVEAGLQQGSAKAFSRLYIVFSRPFGHATQFSFRSWNKTHWLLSVKAVLFSGAILSESDTARVKCNSIGTWIDLGLKICDPQLHLDHLAPAQRGVERDSHGSWQFWCPPKARLLRSIEPQFPRGAWGGMEVGVGIPRGTSLDLIAGDVRFFFCDKKS